jgi:methionyl aminopeptidase
MKTRTVKVGRNDPCPCGSGLKYKKCCMRKSEVEIRDLEELYTKKYGIRLKKAPDIEGIRKAGRLVLDTLDRVEANLRPGIPTEEINTLVHEFTIKNGGIPAPLNYRGFPKSVCVSVNEVICHGIPGDRLLKEGDIVNIDITSILNGYYADANKTFFIGNPGPEARKIVSVSRECLKRGMSMVKPGNALGDIGWAIQTFAEGQGRQLDSGHKGRIVVGPI